MSSKTKHGFSVEQMLELDVNGLRSKSGFPQLWRGYKALRGEYINTAYKTGAFAALLANPSLSAVVVDAHMIWTYVGGFAHGSSISIANGGYSAIASDVSAMATDAGILPHRMQAILWTARKRILDDGKLASLPHVQAWVDAKYSSHKLARTRKDGTVIMPDYVCDASMRKQHGSIDNLCTVYAMATASDTLAGMCWYDTAHNETVDAALECDVTVDCMSHAISALSPGRHWTQNVSAAITLAMISKRW